MNIFFALIGAIAINLVMLVPAYYFKTDKLTDISYSLTFLIIAIFGFISSSMNASTTVLFVMLTMWALRLGIFLFMRISRAGKDRRFDGVRENFITFARFWLLQGLTVWLVLLPSLMFFDKATPKPCLASYIGFTLWLAGFLIELIADNQKYQFNNKNNGSQWINIGLWKYSRHPNYFGEILLWLGVYVYTACSLSMLQAVFAFISPLYIAVLLIFVSGIPILEKSADERFSTDPAYEAYKKRTSLLIPWFPKQNKQKF